MVVNGLGGGGPVVVVLVVLAEEEFDRGSGTMATRLLGGAERLVDLQNEKVVVGGVVMNGWLANGGIG